MKKSVLLTIVNYKNYDETRSLLKSLHKVSEIESCQVVVVDNTLGQQTFESSAETVPFVVLMPTQNLGYMGAAQYALESMGADFDWFILSNSDLDLESDLFVKLNQLRIENCGLIGPSVISSLSSADTNPYLLKRPSAQQMRKIALLFHWLPLSAAYQKLGYLKKRFKQIFATEKLYQPKPQDVYAVHGAFMVFSRAYFLRGGTFKMPFFLFNEEIFAAENCRQLGLRVCYRPELLVRHKEHGSMGKNFSKQILLYKKEASSKIYKMYFMD